MVEGINALLLVVSCFTLYNTIVHDRKKYEARVACSVFNLIINGAYLYIGNDFMSRLFTTAITFVHPVIGIPGILYNAGLMVYRLEPHKKFTNHSSFTKLSMTTPSLGTHLNALGSEIKSAVNNMSSAEFARARLYGVRIVERKADEVSKGCQRVKEILDIIDFPKNHTEIMELGAGRGGWTQVLSKTWRFTKYTIYSRWNQPGQEKLRINPNDYGVKAVSASIEHMVPRYVGTLLSDAGENYPSYDEEVCNTIKLLRHLTKFVNYKPDRCIIRVPNPFNDEVVQILEGWRNILGNKGRIIRLTCERNSVPTVYFVNDEYSDIASETKSLAESLLIRIENAAKYSTDEPPIDRRKKIGIKATWSDLPRNHPVPLLTELNTSKEMELIGPLRQPIGTTNFLKEIGWKPSSFLGTSGTHKNSIIKGIVNPISILFSDLGLWKTTSTYAKDTYATVLRKVDQGPVEVHNHYNRMWSVYKAISTHLNATTKGLRRLSDYELKCSVNRKGAMGWQEKDLGYSNIGEYVDSDTWKPRERRFRDSLLSGRPIWCSYNSIGKKERKMSTSSRLIWFLCATARIYEARIMGHMDTLLKKLPYSVSGMPVYDYGITLSNIFTKGKSAVCDDVAGWDTKISLGILSMECQFLMNLCNNEEHRKEIQQMYRLYAYPLVMITRPYQGTVQDVLYKLRGQVASGRRVTYAMNTITNIVVTMARASYSQDIREEDVESWALRNLRKGHTSSYGGKISGDDSAIIISSPNAEKYATKGVPFMNEIGMPRKDVPEHEPSRVMSSMEEIEFCSHSYTLVDFKGGHSRWMPIRSASEILAKAMIMLGSITSNEKELAWARTQGLNLIVNYPHMPTIRLVALAILSATPNNISLDSSAEGWSYRIKPWIREGDVIDIINGCLFGESTHYPSDYRIKAIEDVELIKYHARREYDIAKGGNILANWTANLYDRISVIRNKQSRGPYDDWIDTRLSKSKPTIVE